MRFEVFWSVSLETSHSKSGRASLNVRVSNSGGVRVRENDTSDGCATLKGNDDTQ